MRKLTILLDLDDVLNNQNELWIQELNVRYRRGVRYEDITGWDMGRFFPRLSARQLYAPAISGELVDKMKPTPGSQDYTWKWYSAGHNLIVVTATSSQDIDKKIAWLYKNFKWFDMKNLISTQRKQLIKGDILIDDGLHNLQRDNQLGIEPQYVKVCMDRPWNRSANLLDGIHRVHNFEEADGIVQLLAKKRGT